LYPRGKRLIGEAGLFITAIHPDIFHHEAGPLSSYFSESFLRAAA